MPSISSSLAPAMCAAVSRPPGLSRNRHAGECRAIPAAGLCRDRGMGRAAGRAAFLVDVVGWLSQIVRQFAIEVGCPLPATLRTFDDAKFQCYKVRMKIKHPLAIVACGVVALVFWPWLGSPFQYVHWKDRLRASIPVSLIFGRPCEVRSDNYSTFDPGSNCYRFGEQRRFTGVWRNEFEGSSFYEGQTALPLDHRVRRETWLDFAKEALGTGMVEALPLKKSLVVKIEFLGRKTTVPGAHGMGGLYPHLIIVDQVLSAHEIVPPKGS